MKTLQHIKTAFADFWRALPDCGLEADWYEMVLVHYEIDPADLQPFIPFPLDLHNGKAYVSLVSFELNRMRPNKSGWPGALLFRAISNHLFLNLRTYVRGPQGPGIYFIREWINNPISELLGPRSYGLPYHFARMRRDVQIGGTVLIRVEEKNTAHLSILVPRRRSEIVAPQPGSTAEFLLERYVAYTAYEGKRRYFQVRHGHWKVEELDWTRLETGLLEKNFPWFCDGKLCGTHRTAGFKNVFMSRPFSCSKEETSQAALHPFAHPARV